MASEIADRYRKVAAQFTQRVAAVPSSAWDNPTPCEGWVARDVVRHLVEWLPDFFFGRWPVDPPLGADVDRDPLAAWRGVDETMQAALDSAAVARLERDTPMGRMRFDQTVDLICTPDVLIHTWDLSRATGLDETIDADEVHRGVQALVGLDDEMMRTSGHFGPRVEVSDDASEQDQLLAFYGRRP
jgi:uncharacterized protein (TIGR03086 family)